MHRELERGLGNLGKRGKVDLGKGGVLGQADRYVLIWQKHSEPSHAKTLTYTRMIIIRSTVKHAVSISLASSICPI